VLLVDSQGLTGFLAIGASEPLLLRSLDPVVLPLRNHQVRMWVVIAATGVFAGMNRERVS
jgi:hypothetical protein